MNNSCIGLKFLLLFLINLLIICQTECKGQQTQSTETVEKVESSVEDVKKDTQRSDVSKFFEDEILHNVVNQLILLFVVILLIMACIKIQYRHQNKMLKERLPEAHVRLWAGIQREEIAVQQRIYTDQVMAQKNLFDEKGKKAKQFDLVEFDKQIEIQIKQGKEYEERFGGVGKQDKILAQGLNHHLIITETMLQERKMKKLREKRQADAEHPECAPSGGHGHSNKQSQSPSKNRPKKQQKAKKDKVDPQLLDIKDTSEHSAYTGNKNASPEPLSAVKPQGRDNKNRRQYFKKTVSQEYSINSRLGGVRLNNKNAFGVRNNILKKSTNEENSDGKAISEISKDGDRKETRSRSKVSFNTSVLPDDKSAKGSVAQNIEEQIKHLSQTQGLMSIDQIKLKSEKDKETEAGGGASEATTRDKGGKMSYWDKINYKKLRSKKQQKAKSAPKKAEIKKSKTSGSRSAQLSTYSSGSEVPVKVRNKDDPQFIFTVGNASQVGERPGEHPYQPVVFDVDTEDKSLVSIFCRKHNLRPDSHMKIIVQHQQEIIKEVLGSRIKERMGQVNRRLHKESCWTKTINCCSRMGSYFGLNDKQIYINKYPIDLYIDRYWLTHCPPAMGVGAINDQVYNLIHQLILADQEPDDDYNQGPSNYQQWGAATASQIKVGGANLMDDSALQGLKQSQTHLGDDSRILDSSYQGANMDQMERRQLFNNNGGSFINIEDQQKRKADDQNVNILNIRNINSEQKVRQQNPKNLYVQDRASKTSMSKWHNLIEEASAQKSPSKFKRAGMKVVRKVKDPEHIADDFGDNSKYSRGSKSQQTRRQKASMDFHNQSQGQMESKSIIGESMSRAEDMIVSNPSIPAESPNKSPDKSITTVPQFRRRDSLNLSKSELQAKIQNQQKSQVIFDEITNGYQMVKNKGSQLQKASNLLEHQAYIQAIMIAIKPKISHMLCKRYTSTMIKSYFAQVRSEQKEIEKKKNERQGLKKQITVEMQEVGEEGVTQLLGILKSGAIVQESSDLKADETEAVQSKQVVDIESRAEIVEPKMEQEFGPKPIVIQNLQVNTPNIKTSVPSHHSQADIIESNQDDDNDGGRTTMGQATLKRNLINDVGLVNSNEGNVNLLAVSHNQDEKSKETSKKELKQLGQLSPTVIDIQQTNQAKVEEKVPKTSPTVAQDIEMIRFNQNEVSNSNVDQEKTPLFHQVSQGFGDQVQQVTSSPSPPEQVDQDMAPIQPAIEEPVEIKKEVKQVQQQSPQQKQVLVKPDQQKYTTQQANKLIEEEVALQRQIAQQEEKQKLDLFDKESQDLQISNDSFEDLEASIQNPIKHATANDHAKVVAKDSVNILQAAKYEQSAPNPPKRAVVVSDYKDAPQNNSFMKKSFDDPSQQTSLRQQSINTQLQLDNRSEGINFTKMANSTRKDEGKKVTMHAQFSQTGTGFNKRSMKGIHHGMDATFDSIESDQSIRQLSRRDYENLDDVQSDKYDRSNQPYLAANRVDDTHDNEFQEATLPTSTGRHPGVAASQGRSMSQSHSKGFMAPNGLQPYEANRQTQQQHYGRNSPKKNGGKAHYGSINVPIGVMGSIVQQSKGLGVRHNNKRGHSKKRQQGHSNRQVYTLENSDSILQYQPNVLRGSRPNAKR